MAAYDHRFVAEFLSELEKQNWPRYPDKRWQHALFIADLREPCTRPRAGASGQHLRNDERYWKSGVRAPDYDGWDAVRVSLDVSIRRFWQKRYGF